VEYEEYGLYECEERTTPNDTQSLLRLPQCLPSRFSRFSTATSNYKYRLTEYGIDG